MKTLVLCADDFAVHPAASRAIVQLASQGRLTATSAMVLSPGWAQDAARLRELRGHLDVGLHLDLTSTFARAAGYGSGLNALMLRALAGRLSVAALRVPVERQLDAFEQHWKAAPDHVDGHQHVQQFAGVREALTPLLQQRYGARAPYLRVSQVPNAQRSIKSRVIELMGAHALRQLAQRHGVACASSLAGIYDFKGGLLAYAAKMQFWLNSTPAGIIMCHPADQVVAGDEIGPARHWEWAFLGSPEFSQQLATAGVSLVRGPT